MVEDGYQFFSQRALLTLFSAANYCGEFDNAGAVMSVSEDLTCCFSILPVSPSGVSSIRLVLLVTQHLCYGYSLINEHHLHYVSSVPIMLTLVVILHQLFILWWKRICAYSPIV